MNIYDKAHDLARAIRESEEYQGYQQAREVAMANDTQKALLDEFAKLQYQLQMQMASGRAPDAELMERMQKLSAVLQLSREAGAYLLAQMRLQQMLADIYKILGEAADIDLDVLNG